MKIRSCLTIFAGLLLAAPAAGLAADVGLSQGLSALAARQHCDECHAIMEARIGPPFLAVAARYAGDRDAAVNRLALKIINGGAGNWGTIPMVPNERISMEDARAIARWILALGHTG
jgi:cytochrome c